ncbi:hypothetical protein OIO90_005876 [Microbotryomycetes sp. JL221]|nr:hypothetical protein OIO90_005876 [Microbotryomycetes sp. JL221]
MQFSRAKRFIDPVDSNVPPVGAYDVPLKLASPSYKRGAMLDKADRFNTHQDATGPDTFGLYDVVSKENKRPRMSMMAPTTDKLRLQMDEFKQRIQQVHDKEISKLESKVTKLSQAREEALSSKADAAKELVALKTEVRNLSSREQHLQAKLTKTETALTKHQTLLPKLQQQLEQLSSSHSDSHKRKDALIVELKSKLNTKDQELLEANDNVERWQQMAKLERQARKDVVKLASDEIERLRHLVDEIRLTQVVELKHKCVRMERQLGDRNAQVEELAGYASIVEQESDMLRAELTTLEQERDWAMTMWQQERDDRQSEKEWRQRARSDQREMLGLRDQVKMLESIRETEREIDATTRTMEQDKVDTLSSKCTMLERELEVAEGELDLATNEEIPRLEDELATVKQDGTELRDRAAELHEALETAENDIKELQARAAEELERHEGEMEEQRRLLADKDKEIEKERAEKRRVAGLLGQSRASQDGLREELDIALAELGRAHKVQSDNDELARTVDQLSRLQAATEQDNKMLADQNTELISHGNPHQKIRHLAQIREELAESKKRHLMTTSDLAAARKEITTLKTEVEAYRSVSPLGASSFGPPASVATRTRVSRPVMDDVLNVPALVVSGERETYHGLATSTSRLHPATGTQLSLSADSAVMRKAGRVTFDEGRATTRSARTSIGGPTRMSGPMTVSELIG